MNTQKTVLIYCGILIAISTFFPWVNISGEEEYLPLFEINLISGLIIFSIGLISIFIGLYHKPEPGKVYSWTVVLLGGIGYFTTQNIVGSIVNFSPFYLGIGTLLLGACLITLEICGILPTPKESTEKENTFEWQNIVMLLLGLGLTFVLLFSIQKAFANNEATIIENDSTNVIIQNTKITTKPAREINPTKTSTPTPLEKECTLWSEIELSDVGKTICVYGIVHDSYWGGDIFYIRFTEAKNSFKFIVLNNYYFKDINGKCVLSTGEIKNFDKVPYMEVREKIYFCEQ